MKIVSNRNQNAVFFKSIKAGQPFYLVDEGWYGIRLEDGACNMGNAVDIETGELADLDDGDKVIAVNGYFRVED